MKANRPNERAAKQPMTKPSPAPGNVGVPPTGTTTKKNPFGPGKKKSSSY